MKKVLLVATVQSHICQFHKPLVELLRENGWLIDVAARDNLKEKNGLKLDFADNVFDVPFCRSPFKLKNINAYKQLKKIIDEGHYDVIHCNTPVGGVLTRIAALKARKSGAKVFYTAHGFHFYKGAPLVNWLIYYPIEKVLSRCTDKLITIVTEDYEFAKKHFKCSVSRIHGTGVDNKIFYPVDKETKLNLRKKFGYSDDQKIILCVGELLANKNQQMILHAMPDILKKEPNAMLLIAGNGPKKEELLDTIEAIGVTNHVQLIGYVTNIHDYHKLSDILVSCSIREGLGLNVIESMLVGNPVVLSDNRGHRELINSGKNGYMAPLNDSAHMSIKVLELINSENQYIHFSESCKLFATKYTSSQVKHELSKIYEFN